MKIIYLLIIIFTTYSVNAQTIFEEDFEDMEAGFDLSEEGYQLSKGESYTGTVTALVTESNGNKFARMVADVNAGANMQIAKAISVEAYKTYTYKGESKGPFKRQLRVLSADGSLLAATADYKPATSAEETEWKTLEVSFTVQEGVSEVQIAFFHYWSGTIDLDNFEVNEIVKQTAFYISSSEGDDANEGTEATPWKTLDKISAVALAPDDKVYFKCGDEFKGHYVLNGSGSKEKPVLITAYGNGDKPIISGQVGADGGGDYMEAIRIENCDNIIIDGIEVKNDRLITRSGINDTDAFGISIHNSSDEVMENLVFRNMTIKDVFAVQPMLDKDDFDAIQVSGMRFTCAKNTVAGKEKNINGILIEDCLFTNLQRLGIQFKGGGGDEGIGNDSINRIMNIEVRNNEFLYNGGSAVLPNRTYNCLIENNIFDHPGASTDPRMPGRGSSVWNINAINTISQYNMCISTRGYLDSHGIHIDNNNVNTFVQYNYMEDCEGGFVEILRGNKNAVYRFNVSVNDGWRYNETWATSNHTIWVNAVRHDPETFDLGDSIFIHNNTVIINKPNANSVTKTSVTIDGDNTYLYNNIFTSTNGGMEVAGHFAVKKEEVGNKFVMTNNMFHGNVNHDFIDEDLNPIEADPIFVGIGEGQDVYKLKEGSPAINSGTNITGPIVKNAGCGVFKDVAPYPTVDFYGNPVDLKNGKLNIGAFNDKPVETSIKDISSNEKWLVYPDKSCSKINVISKGNYTGNIQISLFDLKGQLIKAEQKTINPSVKSIELALNTAISNGIYILNIKGDELSHSRRMLLCK